LLHADTIAKLANLPKCHRQKAHVASLEAAAWDGEEDYHLDDDNIEASDVTSV
jgi:hypothetical protein